MNADRTIRLTREEWLGLRVWIDEHGYNAQRDEPLEDWQRRTAPLSYTYAMIVEAACDHRLDDNEPYCAKCGMLMDVPAWHEVAP